MNSLDRLASAAAAVLEVPLVVISTFEDHRQLFVGAFGLVGGALTARSSDANRACRQIMDCGRPSLVQNMRVRFPDAARHRWGGFDISGYAGVPLASSAGACIGTLSAFDRKPRTWRPRDLVVLRAFGDAAAAVLELERQLAGERQAAVVEHDRTDALHETSLRDELTGLLNRRGFFVAADVQLAAARRSGAPGLVLFFDLDGLKTTNDTHGHADGDELLRRAATVLRATFRESDTIGRLGGDEFVVLATDAPEQDARAVGVRLASELARINRQNSGRIPLTWSCGSVAIDPAGLESLERLVVEADRRMYKSKRDTHPDLRKLLPHVEEPS